MLLKKRYNFQEAKLDKKFAQEKINRFKEFIDDGTSFTVLGMPGIGISYFLRYIATTNLAYFIFVDSYALSALSRKGYIGWLLKELGGNPNDKNEDTIFEECKSKLEILVEKHQKIVIIFNRFDQLSTEFDKKFLANIRSFKYIDPKKIVMIFTANKPLYELAPEALVVTNLHFYSTLCYFGTYSPYDLKELSKITIEEKTRKDKNKIDQLIQLSGGHNQLFLICTKSESKNLLSDRFVNLQLKELYQFLSNQHQKILQKIALGKSPYNVDPYLVNIGLVKATNEGYQIFTPLLTDYIKSHAAIRIPAKEGKLFKLLKTRLNQVVTKDEIFEYVYKNSDDASDWALNALIYRLRKNPTFKSNGFTIESHKKIGYILQKN